MPWFESRPDRLAIEKRLLKQRYPSARLVKKDGLLRIIVSIRGRRAVYQCELIYPKGYPLDTIRAFIRSPDVNSGWHQFRDGSLCLYHSEDVGPETTAVVYMKWLEGWISRYEESLDTGKWRD